MKRLFVISILGFFIFPLMLQSQEPYFIRHTIDQNFPGIHRVKIIDLDMDGDLDIVGGSEQTPYSLSQGLAWWRNEGGYPISWTRFTIDQTYKHVMSVDVAWIDSDPYPDILASSWSNGKICWWQNSGDPTQSWTRHDIVTGWLNAHDAVAGDIDGDGNTDVVGVGAGNNRISVFINQPGTIPDWDEQIISSSFFHALSVTIADLNDNDLPDIIGIGDGCDDIAWWDHQEGSPIQWQKNFVTTYFNGGGKTDAVDIDLDGQLDILGTAWEGNEIAYWICDDITTNSWTKFVVTTGLPMASDARGKDIDKDGDIDIIAIGKMPGKLVCYLNDNFVFTEHTLIPDLPGAGGLAVIDIDGDGDEDILAASEIEGELFLFENTTIISTSGPAFQNNPVKISPNPSSGRFKVTLPDASQAPVLITITNLQGKTVWSIPGKSFSKVMDINLSVPDGIYILVINTLDGLIYREKLIVIAE